MKSGAWVLSLMLGLSAYASGTDGKSIDCEIRMGDQVNHASKALEIVQDDELTMRDSIRVKQYKRSYEFHYDLKKKMATLTVGQFSIQSKFATGQELGWKLGEPYGGPNEQVVCSFGEIPVLRNSVKTVRCRAKEISSPKTFGEIPVLRDLGKGIVELLSEKRSSMRFETPEMNTEEINFGIQKNQVSAWMDELSGRLVDIGFLSGAKGRQFGLREIDAYASHVAYRDYLCMME